MNGRGIPMAGWGVVAPAGYGVDSFWNGVVTGRSLTGPIVTFDASAATTNIVGQIPDRGRLPPHGDPQRMVSSVVVAVAEAMRHAGWTDGDDVDLVIGTTDAVGSGFDIAYPDGGYQPATLSAELAALVADRVGLGGTKLVTGSASAAGLVALALGLDLAASASNRRVVVAAVDGVTRAAYFGLNSLRTLSAAGCRPFSSKRRGIRIGEAAVAVALGFSEGTPGILGSSEGTPGILAGVGVSNHASNWARPEPEGIIMAIESSLADAETRSVEIDYVNLHGPGTKHGDAAELTALAEVLGPRLNQVPLNSSKPVLTHCQGAAGLVELLVTSLVTQSGTIPATHGLADVEERWSDLDLCTENGSMKRGATPESQRSQLAQRIAELRRQTGMSTHAVAAQTGLRNAMISKIELGQTVKPTQNTLNQLARVYGVDPEELYTLAGYHVAHDLPGYTPYLRSKFGDELPPDAVEELRDHFEYVKQKYKRPDQRRTYE